jgi:pyruvate dehydrogenase E2 component (dihydrolipoamide acetyltransferase)
MTMAVEVIIPSLGEVVEDVTILNWLKLEGERVQKGEALLEVESEKVTTEIPSPASGILGKILFPKGAKVAITKTVAIIVAEGEKLPEEYREIPPGLTARAIAPAAGAPLGLEKGRDRIRVAPLARKIAEKEGIDLSLVKPTGPHGTIMKKDVEAYLASIQRQKEEKKELGIPATGEVTPPEIVPTVSRPMPGQKVPVSTMRKTIARRMVKSAFTAPHLCLFSELGMDALSEVRETIKASYEASSQFRISINDFLMKAVALTLREFPYLNARWGEEEIQLGEEINIGLAVALDEGLIVPAIPQVDRLGLEEIARQRIDLVERAKQGKLQKFELERGTFTITSLANFGITHFTAIINPPQSAILSVGATQERLVLREGKVASKGFAIVGLSIDHRVADGSYGAAFLDSLKKKVENPLISFLNL